VGWSLLGAVSIHCVFLACGVPSMQSVEAGADAGPMSYMLEAMRDAAADVLGMETRDAHADDGGALPTCSCPVPAPPPRPDYSFSFNISVGGSAAQAPREDYSDMSVSGGVIWANGKLQTSITFQAKSISRINDNLQTLACTLFKDLNGIDSRLSCVGQDGRLDNYTITTLTDTQVEIRAPSISTYSGAFVYTNVVMRSSDPTAHYLTAPHAYRP